MIDRPQGILPPGLELFAARPGRASARRELGQQEFLALMVAQIQNQNPLQPMESGDFIGQIAQFSTVEGIAGLERSFATLASTLQSSQALQASTMVGRSVLVNGREVQLATDAPVRGALELPGASSEVVVNIHDAAGQLVKRLVLGAQPAGTVPFTWNGLDDSGAALAAGTYRLEARAVMDGKEVSIGTWVPDKVESVSLRSGSPPQLNLARAGPVSLDAIRQVM